MLRREFVWKDNFGCRMFRLAYPEFSRRRIHQSPVMMAFYHWLCLSIFITKFSKLLHLDFLVTDRMEPSQSLIYLRHSP